ncbi:hypothetical protein J6590_015432 [Homalodisca vitripennis]|nr:hypothetical protein J6590_015432 [Homalodisca vitripennis]
MPTKAWRGPFPPSRFSPILFPPPSRADPFFTAVFAQPHLATVLLEGFYFFHSATAFLHPPTFGNVTNPTFRNSHHEAKRAYAYARSTLDHNYEQSHIPSTPLESARSRRSWKTTRAVRLRYQTDWYGPVYGESCQNVMLRCQITAAAAVTDSRLQVTPHSTFC